MLDGLSDSEREAMNRRAREHDARQKALAEAAARPRRKPARKKRAQLVRQIRLIEAPAPRRLLMVIPTLATMGGMTVEAKADPVIEITKGASAVTGPRRPALKQAAPLEIEVIAPRAEILPPAHRAILLARAHPKTTYQDRIRALQLLDVVASWPKVSQRRGVLQPYRIRKQLLIEQLWPGRKYRNAARRWLQVQSALAVLAGCEKQTGLQVDWDSAADMVAFQLDFRNRQGNGAGLVESLFVDLMRKRNGQLHYLAYKAAAFAIDRYNRGQVTVSFADFAAEVYTGQPPVEPKSKTALMRRRRLTAALDWLAAHPSGAFAYQLEGDRLQLQKGQLVRALTD